MEIINRRQRIAAITRKIRRENQTIGFVATMGALHEGHLALIQEARRMADIVIVSIFVNPAQFNEAEDFDKYPRDLTADAALLAQYQVDYVFAPDPGEIYGEDYSTFVTVDDLSEKLEGASRPGHFRGVATIVTILFNSIRPDYAFFGQKDAQQIAVIKRLTRDLGFETEIIVIPIVREPNGLALSSRNALLTEEQFEAATILYKSLQKAELAVKEGERNAAKIAEIVREKIKTEPLAQIDYVAVIDDDTLEPVNKISENPVLVAVAAHFGSVRLIDNLIIEP